jgi:ABC-type glutathione transport system ATPase component
MLEVRNLSKHFPAPQPPWERLRGKPQRIAKAVDDVTFNLNPGEILGLVGESGCGKTTLARTLLRLCEPTSGEALFYGQNIFQMDRRSLKLFRRRVQIVFQDSSLAIDPRYSARQALEEPLLLHGVDGSANKNLIDRALEQVNFPASLLARRPAELSGGQRQRLCLARALVLEPEFLVLDEPLAGLDASVRAQILALLLSLRSQTGMSFLLISHDLDSTQYASDRIAVMYQGRIVGIFDAGRGPELGQHPYVQQLFGAPSPGYAPR